MPDLLETMKKAALQAVDNSKPCAVLFGSVISASPLKIQIGQKLILTEAQLVLTRNVTNYSVTVSTNFSVSVHSGGDPSHSHGAGFSGNKITFNNALKAGESVILIQQSGGQKFIVIDRVVDD